MEFKLSEKEKIKFNGLRSRDTVVATLNGLWGKDDGEGIQMVLLALVPDDTPLEDAGNKDKGYNTIGDLAVNALCELTKAKVFFIWRTLVNLISKLESNANPKDPVSTWNQLVGSELYDLSQAKDVMQRMLSRLKFILRKDESAFGFLSILITHGEDDDSISLGIHGLSYRYMADDIEELIKLLKDGNAEERIRIIQALKIITGKSFIFGSDDPSKWQKWLVKNRDILF